MEVQSLIDRRELVQLLAELVSIPSVNPAYDPASSEGQISRYLQDRLREWNIPYEVQVLEGDRANVLARVEGRNPERALLLEAHLDTASVEGMEIPPFEPEVRDERLYGRGSCDTKAGLAAMLYALKTLGQSGLQPSASVILAGTVDEECSFRGVSQLVASGIRAQGAIVSEPTELEVIVAHKGCLRWRMCTAGRAAHSSRVELGVNAIVSMMKVISAIQEHLVPSYPSRAHPLLGPPTLNIGRIRGGVQINTVPDWCEIEIDRRLLPGEDRSSVWEEFRVLMEKLQAEDPALQVQMMEPMLEDFPLETPEQERVVAVVREACRRVRSRDAVGGVPYGTDASKLSRAGIPSVVLGPGSIEQAHAAVEYVDLQQVVEAAGIYLQVMLEF